MAGVSFATSPITPTGKNLIAPEEPAPASNAAFLADRQLYSTLSEIPCRRATRRTLPPAASTSANSAAFSSCVHFRRRSIRASTSTSDTCRSFWSYRERLQWRTPVTFRPCAATRPRPGAYCELDTRTATSAGHVAGSDLGSEGQPEKV